jgi:hypothetical protein
MLFRLQLLHAFIVGSALSAHFGVDLSVPTNSSTFKCLADEHSVDYAIVSLPRYPEHAVAQLFILPGLYSHPPLPVCRGMCIAGASIPQSRGCGLECTGLYQSGVRCGNFCSLGVYFPMVSVTLASLYTCVLESVSQFKFLRFDCTVASPRVHILSIKESPANPLASRLLIQ